MADTSRGQSSLAADGDPFRDLGPALVLLRKQRGKKQYEAAEAAGFTRGQLSAYEAGRARPSLPSLGRLLSALNSDLGDLHAALRLARARQREQPGQDRNPAPAGLTDDEIAETVWRLMGLLRERNHDRPAWKGME